MRVCCIIRTDANHHSSRIQGTGFPLLSIRCRDISPTRGSNVPAIHRINRAASVYGYSISGSFDCKAWPPPRLSVNVTRI